MKGNYGIDAGGRPLEAIVEGNKVLDNMRQASLAKQTHSFS
jgi:hypothetical protein